jgi:(p)ppGpp synthase/HD superfamily hydrolase
VNGHAIRELAQAWATVAHDGQCRKGAGEPYINHAARVAGSVWGWRRKSIAWLHDVIEDAPSPVYMENAMRAIFPEDIVDDVRALSRLPNTQGKKQPYQEWVEDIAASGNIDLIAVKLADIEDNLSDITDIPGMEGMQSRYLRAKATLLDVAN